MRGTGDQSLGGVAGNSYSPGLASGHSIGTVPVPQIQDLGSPDLGGAALRPAVPQGERQSTRQANGGDALVFIAMGLVSAALGLGLYAHVGLQFPIALIGALGLFVSTSFLHVFVRRMQGVDLLDRRVTALEDAVSHIEEYGTRTHPTIEQSAEAIDQDHLINLDIAQDTSDAGQNLPHDSVPHTLRTPGFIPASLNERLRADTPTAQSGNLVSDDHHAVPVDDARDLPPAYTIPGDVSIVFGREQAPIPTERMEAPLAPVSAPNSQEDVRPNTDRSIDGLVRQLTEGLSTGKSVVPGALPEPEPMQARVSVDSAVTPSFSPSLATDGVGQQSPELSRMSATRPDTVVQREAGETPLISMPVLSAEEEPVNVIDPVEQAMRDAAERGSVDIYLQPILSIDDRKVRFFEVLGRIQGPVGDVIATEDYKELARSMGILAKLDRAALVRSARLLRKLSERRQAQPLFCNISRDSLGDPKFMREFVEFMGGFRDIAPFLIFEIEQSALVGIDATTGSSLRALSSMGFRLSIDHVMNVEASLGIAREFDFSFLKIPFATFLSGQDPAEARARALAIYAAARDNNLTLVVDQIERKDQLAAVVSAGVNLGQGYLFSEPKPLLPQVAAEVADATVAA